MELFHGSNIAVEAPLAFAGRRNLDFGIGFYTTRLKSQAQKWATLVASRKKRNAQSIVSIYQICYRNQEIIDKYLQFAGSEIVNLQDVAL